VFFQGFLVGKQLIQRAIQTLVVDLLRRHAQQFVHRRAAIIMFGDEEFARRIAQPANHQHLGHQRPRHVLFALGNRAFQEVVQLKLAEDLPSEPRSTEGPLVLDPHGRRVHLDPLRRGRVAFPKLELLFGRLRVPLGGTLNAKSARFIELSEVRHGPLPRAAIGAVRFDECPIGMASAVLLSEARANEHVDILAAQHAHSTPKVFTTTASNSLPAAKCQHTFPQLPPTCSQTPTLAINRPRHRRKKLRKSHFSGQVWKLG